MCVCVRIKNMCMYMKILCYSSLTPKEKVLFSKVLLIASTSSSPTSEHSKTTSTLQIRAGAR